MTKGDFERRLYIGDENIYNSVWAPIFIHVKFKNMNLSMTGVVGPKMNGDCSGSCGQIVMGLKAENIRPALGFSIMKINRLLKIWDAWHLNDMRAGCEHQRELGWTPKDNLNDECPVCGYKYGYEWKREEVPNDVIAWLKLLKNTTKTNAWGWR